MRGVGDLALVARDVTELLARGRVRHDDEFPRLQTIAGGTENQRRFERGDFGKLTRAEAWTAMVQTGERIKAAEEAATRAESAYRTNQGRDYWEGAT